MKKKQTTLRVLRYYNSTLPLVVGSNCL